MSRKWFFYLLPLIVVAHVVLAARAISVLTPTYDEPVHLTAGVAAIKKGNMSYNGYHHPILAEAWAALPAVALKPMLPVQSPAWLSQDWSPLNQYRFADLFLYHNRVGHESLMKAARWMQVVLSVLFLCVGAWLILGAYGEIAAFWFATSWACSPTMLAHGTIVSTDLAFAGFFFLFFLAYQTKAATSKGLIWAISVGILMGLCMVSKYLAVALFPIAGLLWILDKRSLRDGVVAVAVGALVVLIVYRGSFGVFVDGLSKILTRSQAGRSSFFLGQHSTQGWVAYFPFAFLAKSTLFELLGLLLAVPLLIKRQLPRAAWIPPLLFFVLACVSKVQIGHRHILAVYPFVFLLGGMAIQNLAPRFRVFAFAAAALMLLEASMLAPNFLTYFNIFVGGPAKGYLRLTDSNNDWGQSLKQLRAVLSPDDLKDGIYLCYFGTADPHAYGLRYINIGSDTISGHADDSGDLSMHPTKFAISATNYQHTYYGDKTVFNWLRQYTPVAIVGNTILVYDFKDVPDALMSLNVIRGGV
jgi:hypothetical protein